jgi:hypothetical protein
MTKDESSNSKVAVTTKQSLVLSLVLRGTILQNEKSG